MHIGHMIGLKKLAQWQALGHTVIFLIGMGQVRQAIHQEKRVLAKNTSQMRSSSKCHRLRDASWKDSQI